MTAETFVANAKVTLEAMLAAETDAAQRQALEFVLFNWFKFEPALVADIAESIRVRQVAGVVWNHLALKAPADVDGWFAAARRQRETA